jgi:hypothetical protein
MKLLVKIFGAQKTPPKLIRSTEVNVPNDTDIKKSDKRKN